MLIVQLVPHLEEVNKPTVTARVLKLSFQFQCGDDLPFLSHNCKEKHSSLGD